MISHNLFHTMGSKIFHLPYHMTHYGTLMLPFSWGGRLGSIAFPRQSHCYPWLRGVGLETWAQNLKSDQGVNVFKHFEMLRRSTSMPLFRELGGSHYHLWESPRPLNRGRTPEHLQFVPCKDPRGLRAFFEVGKRSKGRGRSSNFFSFDVIAFVFFVCVF